MDISVEKTNLSPSENQAYFLGILFGSVGILILLASRFIQWLHVPIPKCVFKEITGYPCVSCGTTRALFELSHFHFLEAFLINPLLFLVGILTGCFAIYSLGVYLFNFPKINYTLDKRKKNLLRYVVIFIILVNWMYLVIMEI